MNSAGRNSPGVEAVTAAPSDSSLSAAACEALLNQATSLMRQNQADEAETLFGSAPKDFLEHRDFAVTRAFCAQQRGDQETALKRWTDVRRRFAEHPYAHAAIASLLLAKSDLDGAEAAIAPALILFPNDADVLANAIQIAITRADWNTASDRLQLLKTTLPDHPFTLAVAGTMDEAIANGQAAVSQHKPWDAGPGIGNTAAASDAETLKQLMLNFESIGDNCELGLVQRHFGVEPLGLFRFAAVWPTMIVDLLLEKFGRLGDPVHTVIDDTGTDYVIKDDRNLYWMHTFVWVGDADPQQLLTQQIKRINYLKRELIEDLEAGDKIFVYKDSQNFVGDDLLRMMAAGLATYGRNLLLAVRRADARNPPGSTKLLGENIIIGYVRKMFPADGPDLDVGSWLHVLEAANRYKVTGFKTQ